MARKYKILKVMKVGSIIVGPGAATRENEEFAKVNAELVEVYDTNKSDVIAAAKDADVILLGSVPVSRWILEAAPKCIAVMCQSVGYDMIDVKAATENNILVVNNPSFEWCIEEVSNHALTLLLDCAKKVKLLDGMVREGRWAEAKKAPALDGFRLRADLRYRRLRRHRQNGRQKSAVLRFEIIWLRPLHHASLAGRGKRNQADQFRRGPEMRLCFTASRPERYQFPHDE